MASRLEVRIPISPAAHYFNRVHLIAHSIRSLGPGYADAHIRVTVGAEEEPRDLYQLLPWSRRLGVEWRWVDRADFLKWKQTSHPYIATMMERYRPPFNASNVLMLDADVVAIRPFDEWLALIEREPGISGVMAHISPFWDPPPFDHVGWWRRLFERQGLATPAFTHEHSGWGLLDQHPDRRFSPPYYNTGVMLAPASLLERLYDPYMKMLWAVRESLDSYFFEQIALTLAIYMARIPFHVVSHRYNFPNQHAFDVGYPDELKAIRFLHFLRKDVIQREADFETIESIHRLVARTDLTGSNEIFRDRVAALLPAMIADLNPAAVS